MSHIAALNSSDHQQLRFISDPRFNHIKRHHVLPLVVHEFVNATQHFPIVFIKDNETGQLNAVAMVGLKTEENLFWRETGWQAHIPEELLCHPFVLRVHSDKPEDGLLCVDLDSPLVSNTEGQRLFSDDGAHTATLQSISKRLADLAHKKMVTHNFIDVLLKFKLLTASTLTINDEKGEPYQLRGIYTLDEKTFNALSDADRKSVV